MLGRTAAASGKDAAIIKKILGSGTTDLIISNDEINNILKIVKSLEDSGLLLEGVRKQLKMKQKNKRRDFLVCYQAH